ncbi:MAG: S8 family serine peptidase [Gaiellaceae bacterium]
MEKSHVVFVAVVAAALCAVAPSGSGAAGTPSDPDTKLAQIVRGGGTFERLVLDPATVDGRQVRRGSLIVRFKPGTSATEQAEAHRAAAANEVHELRLPRAERLVVRAGDEARALAALRARADVDYAQLDGIVRADEVTNDPLLPQLWGMSKMRAPQAWDVTHASPAVRIAILDCGIYSSSSAFPGPDGFGHIDVRTKVALEINFSVAPDTDDFCNHGTHVAGTAAAATNNAIGVAGVGYNAILLNGKVLDDSGFGSISSVVNGLVWAANNNAQVINLSLGDNSACAPALQDAVNYAWSRGAVIVVAAGNDGATPGSNLTRCDNTLSVAATDSNDAKASFSSYGTSVDVAAPGVGIVSSNFFGAYESFSGTSMAAPHVSGLAALVWASGQTTNAGVVSRITSTAAAIPGTGAYWAYGRVDALNAVKPSVAPAPPPAPAPGPRAVQGLDFNGDGRADLGVFRPAGGSWYVRNVATVDWGENADIPVAADYNGDGRADVGVFRPATGSWYIRGVVSVDWGQSGDIPVPADYDGDGRADIAVFRPATGSWYIRGVTSVDWGQSGDIPVPADYNGDGRADIGVFRPATGSWYIRGVVSVDWGQSGDIPVAADYNGDGRADIGVFRPATGSWYIRGVVSVDWGQTDDIPVPADYNGDGRADIGVFRPATGSWYIRGVISVDWGQTGDVPLK